MPEPDLAGEEGYDLSLAAVESIREHLTPIEVWPRAEVDRSLGLDPGGEAFLPQTS